LVRIFFAQVVMWQAWGGWALLIGAVSARLPADWSRWWLWVVVHLALCAVVLCVQFVLVFAISDLFLLSDRTYSLIAQAVGGVLGNAPGVGRAAELPQLESILAFGMRAYGDVMFVTYCAVLLVYAAGRWYERWQGAKLRAAQLDQDLTQARLVALRAQLNPHFLFNALNSVVTLIGSDPPRAQEMTVRLADLLRATLGSGDDQQWTLERELELVRRYLEIEQVRFADRLTVRWQVADGLAEAIVPSFVLQPLVENAIRHGLSRTIGQGSIGIVIDRPLGSVLRLAVHDDGPGLTALSGDTAGAGIALSNLRARLERLYGAGAQVTLTNGSPTGAVAEVRVPLTFAAEHSEVESQSAQHDGR
ncbi:MAG: histidine kinase, partial [Gemmatimonadaceae bacterium]|nr:histidine kinase [Gemmatimonadaceae bacterium]